MGEYEVVGKREYRGHGPGETFHANIPPSVAKRAIDRGDIKFIAPVTPELQPGSYSLPAGWLHEQGKE